MSVVHLYINLKSGDFNAFSTDLRFCLPLVLPVPGVALGLLLGQGAQLGLEIRVRELSSPLAPGARTSGVAADHGAVPITGENIRAH